MEKLDSPLIQATRGQAEVWSQKSGAVRLSMTSVGGLRREESRLWGDTERALESTGMLRTEDTETLLSAALIPRKGTVADNSSCCAVRLWLLRDCLRRWGGESRRSQGEGVRGNRQGRVACTWNKLARRARLCQSRLRQSPGKGRRTRRGPRSQSQALRGQPAYTLL